MSYALSAPLQAAVFQSLSADPVLQALLGDAIFDQMPAGRLPDLYISIGPERVTDASDKLGVGAWHRFNVFVITATSGFAQAKQVAGRVSDILHDADLSLSRGRLVGLRFERAAAKRIGAGNRRQIDLSFRARVEDDHA